MNALHALGYALSGLGAFILMVSGLGVLRMPDALNRMHAGTKATTLGTICLMLGIGAFRPDWLPKLLLLVLFVVLTNPVSSHALARAIRGRASEKPGNLVSDDLEGPDD